MNEKNNSSANKMAYIKVTQSLPEEMESWRLIGAKTYSKFIEWETKKENSRPMTGNEVAFAKYICDLCEIDEKFKVMLTEIGAKERVFILLAQFFRAEIR